MLPPKGPIAFRGNKAKFAKGVKRPKTIKHKGAKKGKRIARDIVKFVDMASQEAKPSTTDADRKADYKKMKHSVVKLVASGLGYALGGGPMVSGLSALLG